MAKGFRTAFDIARELYKGPRESQRELFPAETGREGCRHPPRGRLTRKETLLSQAVQETQVVRV